MSFREYLLLVAAMGAVTYLPRWLPLFALARRKLPEGLVDWLNLIPVALLSALVAPSLFAAGEAPELVLGKPELLAAVPTFLFALKTRSLGGTAVAGMLIYWLIGKIH